MYEAAKNKKIEWSAVLEGDYEAVKRKMANPTALHIVDLNAPLILETDTSGVALGGVLKQVVEGGEFPIVFFMFIWFTPQYLMCTMGCRST